MLTLIKDTLTSQVVTLWRVFSHLWVKADTVEYPDEQPYMFPRWRGRIILSRDPDGEERCVACNLCAVACPVDCIALQKTEDEEGRWYPEFFRINFSRCIMCGFCEEACPTNAIQLTPDFEMAEYKPGIRRRRRHEIVMLSQSCRSAVIHDKASKLSIFATVMVTPICPAAVGPWVLYKRGTCINTSA